MRKKDKHEDLIVYIILGAGIYILLLLIAGNMAYYESHGLYNSLMNALNDVSHLKFHFGLSAIYRNYYGGATAIMGIVAVAFYVNEERFHRDAADVEAGSAKWNTDYRTYNKKYTDPIGKPSNDGKMNMILSSKVKLSIEDMKTHMNNNVLVIGGAGTGKSRYVVKPNILCENCSFVITDPSGELLGSLHNELVDQGYKIKVLNLVDKYHSNCYNPFNYIRDEAGVGVLVDTLLSNTTPPEQKSNDPFWEKSEKALLSACIFYLKDFADKEERNFATVLAMVQMMQIDESPGAKSNENELDNLFNGKGILKHGKYQPLNNKVEIQQRKKALENSQAWKNYQTFRLGGVRTLKSILISTAVRLNPFNITEIENLTSRDTLDMTTVGDEKTAIFVIIPQAQKTYNFIASMMFSQLFDSLYYKAEQRKTPTEEEPDLQYLRLRYHVRIILDEFANTGKIPEFPEKLSTMRKYNISCTIILQSLAQLKAMYEDHYDTILGNCDSTILLGTQEQTTGKYFSEQLGKATIRARDTGAQRGKKGSSSMNFKQTGRELMTMDEIRTMPYDECIVFVHGLEPFYDKKYDLLQHPRYPYTGDADAKQRYDIAQSADFLNKQSDAYGEKEEKPEEPPEASEVVSEPMEASKLGLSGDVAKAIQDIDTEAARNYSRKTIERVSQAVKSENYNMSGSGKDSVICIFEARLGIRYIPLFVRQAAKQSGRSVAIFANEEELNGSKLRTGYLTMTPFIYDTIKSVLHREPEKDQDLYKITGVSDNDFGKLRNKLKVGSTQKSVADDIESILNEDTFENMS